MEAFVRNRGLPREFHCDLVVNKTYDEWLEEGEVHVFLGIGSLIYGIVGVGLYIPCCIVLLNRDIFEITAYKLLFVVSIFQIISLIQNSIVTGIFFIMGIVFCNYPYFNYIFGTTELFSWSGVCCTCFVLGLSRLLDLWNSKWHDAIFGGSRVIISLLFILTYATAFWLYSATPTFNSKQMTWLFDPMVYPDGSHFQEYLSYMLVLNNEGTVSLNFLLTFIFVISFVYKSYFFNFKMTLIQKTLFIQTCISSLTNLTTASIYVSYSFIDGGLLLNYLGLLTWQLSTCGEVIMFLFINKTVHERVFILLGIRSSKIYSEGRNTSDRTRPGNNQTV